MYMYYVPKLTVIFCVLKYMYMYFSSFLMLKEYCYLYFVHFLATAPTGVARATFSMVANMVTTTIQAFTATSISSLVNGKLNSVSCVEVYDLHEYMYTLNTVLLHCFALKVISAFRYTVFPRVVSTCR